MYGYGLNLFGEGIGGPPTAASFRFRLSRYR
jgi:hypothetical protein